MKEAEDFGQIIHEQIIPFTVSIFFLGIAIGIALTGSITETADNPHQSTAETPTNDSPVTKAPDNNTTEPNRFTETAEILDSNLTDNASELLDD